MKKTHKRYSMLALKIVKKIKLRTWIALGILLVLLPVIFVSLFHSQKADAAWFNDSWTFRKKIPITAHTGAETSKYFSVTVDSSDTTKFQSDCGDIRFTDNTGALLQYYIASGCSSASTVIHVLVPTFPAGATDYYMYYGNASAQNGFSSADFTAGTSVTVGTVGSEETGTGPMLYWNLDDGSGTVALDSSSNKNNGSATGTWQPEQMCITGGCLFTTNSSLQGMATSTLSSFSKLTTGTVSIWARFTGTNRYQDIYNMYRNADTTGTGFELNFDNQTSGGVNIEGYAYKDGSQKWAFTVSSANFNAIAETGKWHLYTLVHDGTTPSLYIDGKSVPITFTVSTDKTVWFKAFLTDATSKSDFLSVGTVLANNTPFNQATAFYDEFKVYPYARSAAQIKTDYSSRATTDGVSARLGGTNQKFLSDGLVGYWKMDESSANTCSGGTNDNCDSSGYGNDGAWNGNATTTTPAKYGRGVTFDGSGDYVKPPDISTMVSNSSAFTISAWVNPTTVASAGSILGHYSGNTFDFAVNASGGLYYEDASSSYNSTASVVTANVWNHVLITHNGTDTVRFYVNGKFISSATTAAVSTTGAITSLGHAFVGDFSGKMDDVRIYKREFTAQEVSNLYNIAPGPVGYWKADDASNSTTLADSSGNGTSCTINNAAPQAHVTGKFGKALFPGYNVSHADCSASTVLSDLPQLSMSAWIYVINPSINLGGGTDGYNRIFANGNKLLAAGTNNVLAFYVAYSTTALNVVTSNNTVPLNQWVHVEATWDGTTAATGVKIYINGVETTYQLQTSGSGTVTADSQQWGLGSIFAGNDYATFDGYLDEMRIYNYPRSNAQVVEDMNGGHPIGGSPIGSYTSYWKMDEANGTTAHDANSINQNDLTLSTATSAWTTSGKVNSAWVGAGTNWLSRADDNDFDLASTDDASISMWFKSTSATNPAATQYLFTKGGPSSVAGYALYATTSGTVCFGIDDDTTWGPDDSACSTADIYDATWHHLVAEKTGTSEIRLYVDGRSVGSDTSIAATSTLANSSTLYVGDDDGDSTNAFAGTIDEVKFYRGALTQDQVFLDYNAGASVNYGVGAANENTQIVDGAGNPPVGYWPMDENTGTSTNDVSGNGLTGTLTNGPTWATGKISSGVKFDGVDDRVQIAHNALLNTTSGFTVEAWVKVTGNAGSIQDILFKGVDTFGGENVTFYLQLQTTGQVETGYTDSGMFKYIDSNTTLSLNTWYHLTGVYDSTNGIIKIYINGALDAQNLLGSGTMDTNTNPLIIGVGDSSNFRPFTGIVDDVKVYNYNRTDAQIAYDYNRGLPVAWWKMDECQGTTINDSSGNGITGTWSGSGGSQTAVGTCTTASTAWGNGAVGKYNSSLSFDGTDDKVEMSDTNALSFGDGTLDRPFSISAWVNMTDATSFEIFNKLATADTTHSEYGFYTDSSDHLFLEMYSAGSESNSIFRRTNAALTTYQGAWTHVVGTYDGTAGVGGIKLYINGNQVATADTTAATAGSYTAMTNTTGIPRIGADPAGSLFSNGKIDDVRVYGYALSASQVKKIYNNGSSVFFGPVQGTPVP